MCRNAERWVFISISTPPAHATIQRVPLPRTMTFMILWHDAMMQVTRQRRTVGRSLRAKERLGIEQGLLPKLDPLTEVPVDRLPIIMENVTFHYEVPPHPPEDPSLHGSILGNELGIDDKATSTNRAVSHQQFFAQRDECVQEGLRKGWVTVKEVKL